MLFSLYVVLFVSLRLFLLCRGGVASRSCAPSATKVETAAPLYPSFFRTDAQSITVIQKTFEEAMAMSVKTKCIRFLLKHSRRDGCFNFSDMTNEQRAAALNSVQDKHHFTAGDFENACHISRKK